MSRSSKADLDMVVEPSSRVYVRAVGSCGGDEPLLALPMGQRGSRERNFRWVKAVLWRAAASHPRASTSPSYSTTYSPAASTPDSSSTTPPTSST